MKMMNQHGWRAGGAATACLGALVAAGALIVAAASSSIATAAETGDESVESVTLQKGVVLATVKGKPTEATNEITFPKAIVIGTNGTFKVGGGRERSLIEGQILSREGMLTSPDGSVIPVEDHLVSRSGRILIVRDGESRPLGEIVTLKNGTRVYPDGRMVTTRNALRRLLDGQIVRLNETAVESTDTAQLVKGRVVLQKDGGRIELRPGQTITMADGSKVNASGLVVKRDGSRVTLVEGELLKFPGAGDGR